MQTKRQSQERILQSWRTKGGGQVTVPTTVAEAQLAQANVHETSDIQLLPGSQPIDNLYIM